MTNSFSTKGPFICIPSKIPGPAVRNCDILSSTRSPARCNAGLIWYARIPASTSSEYETRLTFRPLNCFSESAMAFCCSAVSLRGATCFSNLSRSIRSSSVAFSALAARSTACDATTPASAAFCLNSAASRSSPAIFMSVAREISESARCSIATPAIITIVKNALSIFSKRSQCLGIVRTATSPTRPATSIQNPKELQSSGLVVKAADISPPMERPFEVGKSPAIPFFDNFRP